MATEKQKKEGFFSKLKRYWKVPKNRAKQYVEEQKAKVHIAGAKEGTELTEFEKGLRSGYLQCQSDHAGVYKYKQAIAEGKSKSEAKKISQEKVKKA